MTVRIIAHRARPAGLPENSLAGIRKAIEMGADGIELDVRRSLDSVPVLMHDWSLRRTTGLPGPALLYPLFVLRRLRLQRSAETVPMLAQALDVLSGDAFLALDLKEASAARRILHLVKERRLERRVLLWTEDADTARLFGREAPETEVNLNRRAHTTGELKKLLLDARSCGARAVSIDCANRTGSRMWVSQ